MTDDEFLDKVCRMYDDQTRELMELKVLSRKELSQYLQIRLLAGIQKELRLLRTKS